MDTLQPNDSPQIDSFCRFCLLQKPHLRSLSSQIQSPMTMSEMLYKITGTLLNMNEQLPRAICERCLVKLELAYNISEEFRKQEELLRRLSWKGVLLDELVEYQRPEKSRGKPYSEDIIARLTAVDDTNPLGEVPEHENQKFDSFNRPDSAQVVVIKQEAAPFEDQLDLVKPELFEATEFSIQVLPDDSTIDEEVKHPEWKQQPNEIIDNGLEMVLELEDLRTIGALPDEMLEQLDMQQMSEDEQEGTRSDEFIPSSAESEEEYGEDEDQEDGQGNNHVRGQFQCKICNKSNESQEELDAHHLSRHKAGKKPWKHECKYCQRRFQRNPELVLHEKVHENRLAAGIPEPNQGPLKCPICNRRYLNFGRYNFHLQRHENIEKGTFRCKFCDHPFSGLPELKRHERNHETKMGWRMTHDNITPPIIINENNKTVYKCEECGKVFATRFRYFHHAQKHIIRKTGMFQCQDCGNRYDNKKSLRHHQRTVHNLSINPEIDEKETEIPMEPAPPLEIEKRLPHCSECNAFFLSQIDHKIHMSVHGTGSNQKTLVNFKSEPTDEDCQQLEDTTPKGSLKVIPSTPVELNESMTPGSVWKCDECGESVKLKSDRTYGEHRRKHERIRNVTMKCEVCRIAFPTSIELSRHRRSIHGLVTSRTLGDRDECPLCKKSIMKNVLQQHIKLHESLHLRKHVCPQCDSAYGTLKDLRKHVQANKCKEPGYSPKRTEEALSMDVIRAFFKWVAKRRSPTGVESKPLIEEQDGLFKCKECGRTFEGFASVAYHTERHKAYVPREDQVLNVQSKKRPRNDHRSDSSDLDLLE